MDMINIDIDMTSLKRALVDAQGVVETAAIMLMSADEASSAVDPITGVDLANVIEDGGRTRKSRSNRQ